MKLSDLQGFESDAEIKILITEIYRKKAIAKSELSILQKDLSRLNHAIDNILQYSSSEKQALKQAIDEYDAVNHQIKTLSQAGYINDRLQKQKDKILSIVKDIESLMYKAAKSDIYLPCLAFSVVSDLDKYGLHLS